MLQPRLGPLTSVILLIGSTLVIVENVPKLLSSEKVNYDGMLVLGIVKACRQYSSQQSSQSHGHSHNESILSLHFLEDILGWLAVILLICASLIGISWIRCFLNAGFILSKCSAKILMGEYPDLPDHVPSDVDLSQLIVK